MKFLDPPLPEEPSEGQTSFSLHCREYVQHQPHPSFREEEIAFKIYIGLSKTTNTPKI
jgi:hypothetical protein